MFNSSFNFDFYRKGLFNFKFVQHRPPFIPPTLSHTFNYDSGRGITTHINIISSHISAIPRLPMVNPIDLIHPAPEPPKLDLKKHEVIDKKNGATQIKFIIHNTEPMELTRLKEAHNAILTDIYSGKLLNDTPQFGAPAAIKGIDMIARGILGPPQIIENLKKTEQAVYNYCFK